LVPSTLFLADFLLFPFLPHTPAFLALSLSSRSNTFRTQVQHSFSAEHLIHENGRQGNETARERSEKDKSSEKKKDKREGGEKRTRLTDHKLINSLSNLEYNTSSLVSQNTITFHNQGSNTSSLPEMDI
jgi:hypothetical protein